MESLTVDHWSPPRTVLSPPLLLFVKVEVQLVYNVVFISAVQQSDSFIHVLTESLLFHIFFLMVYPRTSNIVPCSIQQDLIMVHSSDRQQFTSANPKLSVLPSPVSSPSAATNLFSVSVRLFLNLHKNVSQIHIRSVIFLVQSLSTNK